MIVVNLFISEIKRFTSLLIIIFYITESSFGSVSQRRLNKIAAHPQL